MKYSEITNEADAKIVRKAIMGEEGKKINLERMSKLSLNHVYSDDTVKSLTWKEFKASKVPFNDNKTMEDAFLKALLKQIKNFGKQVDYNVWLKKSNPSFEDKVDWLLSNGAKYSKSGIKN